MLHQCRLLKKKAATPIIMAIPMPTGIVCYSGNDLICRCLNRL